MNAASGESLIATALQEFINSRARAMRSARVAKLEETMNRAIETQVLIVGAGPVGLTLAIDLAGRGIDVIVAESRDAGEPPRIRSNHVSARSMEIFRRLGIAEYLVQHQAVLSKIGDPEDFGVWFSWNELPSFTFSVPGGGRKSTINPVRWPLQHRPLQQAMAALPSENCCK